MSDAITYEDILKAKEILERADVGVHYLSPQRPDTVHLSQLKLNQVNEHFGTNYKDGDIVKDDAYPGEAYKIVVAKPLDIDEAVRTLTDG